MCDKTLEKLEKGAVGGLQIDVTIKFIESIVQITDSHVLSSNVLTFDTTSVSRIYRRAPPRILEERSLRYTV